MTARTDEEKAELLKALQALVAECEQEVADKGKASQDAVESAPARNSFGAPVAKTNLPREARPKGRILQLQFQEPLPPKNKG